MGFIRPKIYLPSALSEQGYIILHEQHHIRRGDHLIKALAFIALCIHWFNPLVWVAFVLSSKDMEMSCDEAVVKKLGHGIRADYSASLLSLATGRRIIAGTPLAFGEGDTKSRIKNMLNWKKPKTWIMLVALIACVVAIVFCATNPRNDTEENSMVVWEIKREYPKAVVDIVNDYVMQQVAYYNDLGSGENAIGGEYSILEAKVVGLERRCRVMETETHCVELYRLEYRLLPSEPGHVVLADGMQMEDGWITEYGSTGQPYFAFLCDSSSGEETRTLIGMTNSRTINIDYNTDAMRAKYGDRYVAAAMELYKAYLDTETQASYGTASDVSYYLELAAGENFQNMNLDRQNSLLVEYEDLLDDYTLMARETEDGKTAYIVGQYNGDPTQSPLYGMYSVEVSLAEDEGTFQFLYPEEESETVEAVLAASKKEFPPSAGYRIEDSWIYWSANSGLILIQPKDNALFLNVPWNRYLHTPNGREYIVDAVSRGIDICGRTDTFLYVYRISEQFGEISERIALTEAEAQAILAEERVSITDGFGFSASLHIDGQTIYYNERKGIPQTVLDLAVEKCDYRFGDPSYITDTIREAQLDCDWLDAPLYASEEDLPRLREFLKNAQHDFVGACGYGAKLTLTFTGGEKLTVFKGCDSCDSIVFGSYGGYFIGDEENREFWEMFGLDPDTKTRIETNSADAKDTVMQFFNEGTWRGATFLSRDFAPSNLVFNSPDTLTNIGRAFSSSQWEYVEAPASEPSWENLIEMYPFVFYDRDGLVRYGGPSNDSTPWDEPPMEDAVWYRAPGVFEAMQEATGTVFTTGILLPIEQLSAVEQAATVDAIFTNLKTGWWNGIPLKSCAYESAAFECLHREVNGNIVSLYGYGGYFRWDEQENCVEHWLSATIVTLDADTQQLLELWWPGDGAAVTSAILNRFPESIASTVAEPDSDRYATVRNILMESSKEFMVEAEPVSGTGVTRRFGFSGLKVEVTNVLSAHKTCMMAEGIELHEYVVLSCTPDAKITVLDANMSDPTYAEDGKPHPQWGLYYTGETERTRITDETISIPVTPDLEGIYNLEASLFVIQVDLVD